ncbi:hypothetical protein E2562_001488 [Oryza meyeriana var. granulata]|uniref:Uncharacterized protein n=1 Tax=Oryza meyeriana var. granulata TaxID=110450 RepID=A0A6G1DBZ1_9ORYZ|nr:hypothetical protein E2562_001488 [Oryza meyeriana var. granulata]
MGEPAPPEPSEPNPTESNDATASDATASDATSSDWISEEQEGSPMHPNDLLEACDSPQRDDARPRPPHVDYTHYKATGMRRLRQVLEADWFPIARDPHGTLGNIRLWTRVQKDLYLAMRDKMGPGQTGLSEHQALQWTSLSAAAGGFDIRSLFTAQPGLSELVVRTHRFAPDEVTQMWDPVFPTNDQARVFLHDGEVASRSQKELSLAASVVLAAIRRTLITRKGTKEGVTAVMQWVLYHLFSRQRFDIVDLMLAEMEDVIYNAIGCQLPYGPYLFALLRMAELVDIVSYRMLPCTISTYSPAPVIDRRHGDRALPVPAAGVPAVDSAEEEAPREDIPVQDLREATRFPRSAPPMPRASSNRSPREPPCPPTSTDMPTSAGTAAPSSAVVERLTSCTGATEEDPATVREVTLASVVVRPTTEDDTTAIAEVSSTAFTNVDETAGRPTPLACATKDHPPTKEGPASTIEGDTTAPAEVSPSAFHVVDEAAGRPTPLTGATEDRTPAEEDPASTSEDDTTAPSEVSPITLLMVTRQLGD